MHLSNDRSWFRRASLGVVSITLTLTLSAVACDNPTGARYAPAERLAGRWSWVSSLEVETLQLHTPQTEGYAAELRFEATSGRDGVYTYARIGGSEIRGNFLIGSGDGPGNDFIHSD